MFAPMNKPLDVVALRHMPFEDAGAFAPVFAQRGDRVRYFDVGIDEFDALDPLSPDLLVVLGGAISAYQEDQYPFLIAENDFIARRIAADRPTLGICLGSQLMAKAMGARVYRNAKKEIGFAPISLTDSGRTSCLAPYGTDPIATHWHGDTFDLPEGVSLLASSALCANQAFSRGPHVIAFQFHPEAGGPRLESWVDSQKTELARAGLDENRLRDDAKTHGPNVVAKAAPVLTAWLNQLR